MMPTQNIAKIIAMAANPQAKSFHDIVRYHSYCLVNPLQWTSYHLNLVGCRFEDVGTPPVYAESTQNDHRNTDGRKPCPKLSNDAEALAMELFLLEKQRRLTNILVGEERPFSYFRKGAPFYFQGRRVHQPNYIVFHRHKATIDHIHNGSPSLVGYVHYTKVNGDRRRQFEPCPGPRGGMNSVGVSICQKRLAQTTPKEWTEDPYFICHLLALAQLQERKLDLPKPTIYTSRLLVTNVLDREYILYYEAQITTELLNGLKNPKDSTGPMKWPTIRRRKVPYKPYLTFADRLVAELVAPSPLPSHGPFNPSDDVNGVFEYGRKRPREQGDNGSDMASKRGVCWQKNATRERD